MIVLLLGSTTCAYYKGSEGQKAAQATQNAATVVKQVKARQKVNDYVDALPIDNPPPAVSVAAPVRGSAADELQNDWSRE